MRGPAPIALLFALAASSAAQDRTADTVRFLRHAWTTVAREGAPELERAKVAWPQEVRRVRDRVATLSARWSGRIDDASLRQRIALVAELWRVRSSLNLLSLLSPEALQQIAGIDPSALRSLRAQADRLWSEAR